MSSWCSAERLCKGGRHNYWTENLESIQRRKSKAYMEARRTGLKEAWKEHQRLHTALKRMIRREKRRRATQIMEELLHAPLEVREKAKKVREKRNKPRRKKWAHEEEER